MACNSPSAHRWYPSVVFPFAPRASFAFPYMLPMLLHSRPTLFGLATLASSIWAISGSHSCTWDDVAQVSQPERFTSDDSFDPGGYFEKVKFCNRNSFCRTSKAVSRCISVLLRDNSSLSSHVTLHPLLVSPEDRTHAVGDVISCLGEKYSPGIRKELFPVTSSFGAPTHFSLERAAAPYFGIKAYGVFMNGYVEKSGEKFLWIGKRSKTKQTNPGMRNIRLAGNFI